MVKSANELQPSKAHSPITVTELGMVTFANDRQPWKAQSPITVTESGMVTFANERQPRKAESEITQTELGMVTVANEVQLIEAFPLIRVTELEMVTSANELQPKKALSPISATLSGISTTRRSSCSTPEVSRLEHVTGFMLRKAKTSAPRIALDTNSLLFNRGLSPRTSSTELMFRFDSSAQRSHPCSCRLNSPTVMSGNTWNDSSSPDSCRTVISFAMAEFYSCLANAA